jgi:PBSX family phage terminase large subunit
MANHPGTLGVVSTRTYPMLRDVVIRQFLEIVPDKILQYYNKTEAHVKLTNGAEALFRPLETANQIDRLRGLTINWFWMDEAAYCPGYAFKILCARLRQGKDRAGAITTTPAGFNWVHKKFADNPSEQYQAVMGVTSYDNPFLPDGYVEDLKREYSAEYLRQEVFGEFVKFQGLVYSEFKETEHCISRADIDRLDFKDFIYGYDSGFRNPRVLLKIGITTDERYVIVDEFYRREARLSDSISAFKNMGTGGVIYADPSAKGEIEELKKAGFRAEAGNNDVEAGVQKVKQLLKNKNLLVAENCQNVLNEINTYRWDEEKDRPVKESDHAMDALRYALYSMESGPGGTRKFIFE